MTNKELVKENNPIPPKTSTHGKPCSALYIKGVKFSRAPSRLDSFDVEERTKKQKTDKCQKPLS